MNKHLKLALLLALLFIPGIGAPNGQVLKIIIVSLMCVLHRKVGIRNTTILSCGLLALLSGFLSTIYSWHPSLGMIGGYSRVEGWVMAVVLFYFSWFCFWDKEEGQDWEDFATLIILIICAIKFIFGWWLLDLLIAKKLGIGMILAILIPISFSRVLKTRNVISIITCILGFIVLLQSECRSALAGCMVGILFLIYFLCKRPFIYYNTTVLGSIVGILVCPSMRHKLWTLSPTSLGKGPRSDLILQFLHRPPPLLGFGFEEQRYLIQWKEGFEEGLYDRYHFWPCDVTCSTGWIGLACCLITLWIIFKYVRQNTFNYSTMAFTGSLIAYLVSASFNPPTMQAMLLASITSAGILRLEDKQDPTVSINCANLTLKTICFISVLIYGYAVFYQLEGFK